MNLAAIDIALGGQKLQQEEGTSDSGEGPLDKFVADLKASGRKLSKEEARKEVMRLVPNIPEPTLDAILNEMEADGVVVPQEQAKREPKTVYGKAQRYLEGNRDRLREELLGTPTKPVPSPSARAKKVIGE